MKRYIAVDSGKGHTKVAVYDAATETVKTASFETKYEEGTFEDTDPGKDTYLVEMKGHTYKVGHAATIGTELISSKKTFVHKLSTLFAIARECSEDEVDEVYVAIGIPVKDYQEVAIRNKYREFILPEDEIEMRYKLTGESEPVTKKFKIVGRYVYPETYGAIFANGVDPTGTVGVVDIGFLNVNMTMFDAGEIDSLTSVTTDKGAKALISGLAQKLSAAFSRVNEKNVMELLKRVGDNRCLKPTRPNLQIEKDSKNIVDKYINTYVTDIMNDCRAAQWPVDYTQFVFIGGTINMIENEVKEVFGEDIIIPEESSFVNAIGFLKAMCGRKDVLRIKIAA